ncbi:uncharacterized protein LOC100119098 isoform X2 [Nasonia vitripennis]|uniref:Uncharacterized protein n=1 Tax=Nasonia vitripennis TaxID=7425 RepID=A0A7M7Q7H8_NASVI|nr:uncharacterized protein LOC100119098 isoform X2 [Nasonia vitripennis]
MCRTLWETKLTSLAECQSHQEQRQLSPQAKETTAADFIRLVVMRLIFGLASAMGYGEGLSNVLGGIFVPPGADYDDDYDFVPDLF